MALGDNLPSIRNKIREGDVTEGRPNSEAVQTKISQSLNWAIDNNLKFIELELSGFFAAHAPVNSFGGVRRIRQNIDISFYNLSLEATGSSGYSELNFNIYDQVDAFVGTLFGTGAAALRINGVNASRAIIENDIENATTYISSLSGGQYQLGTLNFTTLLAGWKLVPDINSAGGNAKNLFFQLGYKEQ